MNCGLIVVVAAMAAVAHDDERGNSHDPKPPESKEGRRERGCGHMDFQSLVVVASAVLRFSACLSPLPA